MSYLESSARPVSFAAVLVAVDVAGLLAIGFAPLFFPSWSSKRIQFKKKVIPLKS